MGQIYGGLPSLGDYHGTSGIISGGKWVESATDDYADGNYNWAATPGQYGVFTTVDF